MLWSWTKIEINWKNPQKLKITKNIKKMEQNRIDIYSS